MRTGPLGIRETHLVVTIVALCPAITMYLSGGVAVAKDDSFGKPFHYSQCRGPMLAVTLDLQHFNLYQYLPLVTTVLHHYVYIGSEGFPEAQGVTTRIIGRYSPNCQNNESGTPILGLQVGSKLVCMRKPRSL